MPNLASNVLWNVLSFKDINSDSILTSFHVLNLLHNNKLQIKQQQKTMCFSLNMFQVELVDLNLQMKNFQAYLERLTKLYNVSKKSCQVSCILREAHHVFCFDLPLSKLPTLSYERELLKILRYGHLKCFSMIKCQIFSGSSTKVVCYCYWFDIVSLLRLELLF